MRSCITTSSFALMVNDGHFSSSKASRGLRQRDPLFLFLFTIVMKVLTKLAKRARELRVVEGGDNGHGDKELEVSHLFFH